LGTHLGTQVDAARAGQRKATTLRALLPDSPQEIRDTCAQEDMAQVPDPEAEAYTNVVASLGLGQITQHTQSSKSPLGIGCASGDESALVTHGFSLLPSLTRTTSSELPQHLGTTMTKPKLSDPSLAPNVGPAGTCISVGGLPQLAVGREMSHPSWSLAERIPKMYTIPATDVVYEQLESALMEQERVLVSEDSIRSQESQGSEETLSPNQDGTFSYGFRHRASCADQADISSVVADTVRQAYTGIGARPRTLDNPVDVGLRSLSDTAGPSKPAHTEFSDFFDIEPDAPVFKMPHLPAPRTMVTEMSATRTNVTLRHTSHEVPMTSDHHPQSRSSTSQPCSCMSTMFTRGHSSPHSSVQEWLQQVTPGAPPMPTVVTSQAVSELPMGAIASALAPQGPGVQGILTPTTLAVLVTVLGHQWQWIIIIIIFV